MIDGRNNINNMLTKMSTSSPTNGVAKKKKKTGKAHKSGKKKAIKKVGFVQK